MLGCDGRGVIGVASTPAPPRGAIEYDRGRTPVRPGADAARAGRAYRVLRAPGRPTRRLTAPTHPRGPAPRIRLPRLGAARGVLRQPTRTDVGSRPRRVRVRGPAPVAATGA